MAQVVPIEVAQALNDQLILAEVLLIMLIMVMTFIVIVIRGVPWRLGVARLRRRFVIAIPRANNKLDLISVKKYAGAFVENLKTMEVFKIVPDAFMDFGGIRLAIAHELAALTLPLRGFALVQYLRSAGVNTSSELVKLVDTATDQFAKGGEDPVIPPPPGSLPSLEYKSKDKKAEKLTGITHMLLYFHAIIGFFIDDMKISSGRELHSKIQSSARVLLGEQKGSSFIKGAIIAGLIMVFAALAAGIGYNMTASTPHPVFPSVPAPASAPAPVAPVQPQAPAQVPPPVVQPPQELPKPPGPG